MINLDYLIYYLILTIYFIFIGLFNYLDFSFNLKFQIYSNLPTYQSKKTSKYLHV